MTWGEFRVLFMGKYFPAIAKHSKAYEFLELRQRTMTGMQYVVKFTEFVDFGDDYVATDLAKVRRFENGMKLSIRGKIVGLRLHDLDSKVEVVMTIERELDDTRSIRDAGASGKRKEDQPSSSLGKRQRTFVPQVPQLQGHPKPMTCFYCHHHGHMKRDCLQRQGF